MLIPWGSDAPLYHLPIATGSMILANVAAFVGTFWLATVLPEEQFANILSALMLEYGTWKPWQWVTSNFMHAGLFHLLGNMFCLWGFGFVVEGKIGWWRFLLIYLGIGLIQCGFEQTIMVFANEGGSLGASAIIYGLMAICMVWAPENEMNCIVLLGFRFIAFDITLYWLAIGYLILSLVMQAFEGLTWGSQALHLMGAGLGFGVGFVMLKKNLVDCEGWDLISVWRGQEGQEDDGTSEEAAALVQRVHKMKTQERGTLTPAERGNLNIDDLFGDSSSTSQLLPIEELEELPASVNIDDVRRAIARAEATEAFSLYGQFTAAGGRHSQRELLQTIALFHKQKLWETSIPAMVAYLRHFTDRAPQVRLKLAKILLQVSKRPAQAAAVLAKIDPACLKDDERAVLAKLQAAVEKMAGTVSEPPIDDW